MLEIFMGGGVLFVCFCVVLFTRRQIEQCSEMHNHFHMLKANIADVDRNAMSGFRDIVAWQNEDRATRAQSLKILTAAEERATAESNRLHAFFQAKFDKHTDAIEAVRVEVEKLMRKWEGEEEALQVDTQADPEPAVLDELAALKAQANGLVNLYKDIPDPSSLEGYERDITNLKAEVYKLREALKVFNTELNKSRELMPDAIAQQLDNFCNMLITLRRDHELLAGAYRSTAQSHAQMSNQFSMRVSNTTPMRKLKKRLGEIDEKVRLLVESHNAKETFQ